MTKKTPHLRWQTAKCSSAQCFCKLHYYGSTITFKDVWLTKYQSLQIQWQFIENWIKCVDCVYSNKVNFLAPFQLCWNGGIVCVRLFMSDSLTMPTKKNKPVSAEHQWSKPGVYNVNSLVIHAYFRHFTPKTCGYAFRKYYITAKNEKAKGRKSPEQLKENNSNSTQIDWPAQTTAYICSKQVGEELCLHKHGITYMHCCATTKKIII